MWLFYLHKNFIIYPLPKPHMSFTLQSILQMPWPQKYILHPSILSTPLLTCPIISLATPSLGTCIFLHPKSSQSSWLYLLLNSKIISAASLRACRKPAPELTIWLFLFLPNIRFGCSDLAALVTVVTPTLSEVLHIKQALYINQTN